MQSHKKGNAGESKLMSLAEPSPAKSHPAKPLRTAREAVNYSLTGRVLRAVSTAGFAWKHSRSLHGAGLSFLAGGVFGWTFGHEIANQSLQLYRVDTLAAQTMLLEWWERKAEGHF